MSPQVFQLAGGNSGSSSTGGVGRPHGIHLIRSAGGGVARFGNSTEAADVGHDLPDLIVGDLAAEGGHAVGPAIDDAVENNLRIAAMDPEFIHQGRPDSAAAVGVTSDTVECAVEALSFGDGVGI